MKDQVLSIEQMQELKELGIDISKASCEWMHTEEYGWTFTQIGKGMGSDMEYVPTFTLQDILEMLPKNIDQVYKNGDVEKSFLTISPAYDGGYEIEYWNIIKEYGQSFKSISLLEAAFNMLKWCKQNNYI